MKAFLTGITGQDGSYLAELLLSKGYEVHGLIRRTSTGNLNRINHIVNDVQLHYGDLSDPNSIQSCISEIRPSEVYNLAAQSDVKSSFDSPLYAASVNAIGVESLLASIRKFCPECRFYQASTSELFGNSNVDIQSESTPFRPNSPYSIAKLYAYWTTVRYRDSYSTHASNGILFNHESPRRGNDFVTKKIAKSIAQIKSGQRSVMYLGTLDTKRDWGFAPEYVEAMWKMLQRDIPSDYVVATGKSHSVREFCEMSARCVDMNISWEGSGLDEVGIDTVSGKTIIKIDSQFYRPAEVYGLKGDATKASRELGWKPAVQVSDLAKIMVDHEMRICYENRN